ncbi:hypothetical protein B0O80DRAFT_234343 [Mortierella sp. GBAus27b]|jgi:hypothetical protein|nr:hypothetical protein B0O80DRAFT_234343 [Mortierella sp. GBAus27b]
MKSRVAVLLALAASSVLACGEYAYRCVNPSGNVEEDWRTTNKVADMMGYTNSCWCEYRKEWFYDTIQSRVDTFKRNCESYSGYTWRNCPIVNPNQ